jgi:hypothetical protein
VSISRVILITVAGPAGHVDIGVRSDATPGDLASSFGDVIGVIASAPVAEHRAPPRPGFPAGRRAGVASRTRLADAGVADGDLIFFASDARRLSDGSPAGSAREYEAESGWPGESRAQQGADAR